MMNAYLKILEKSFVTQGGIKERMHQSRTGYRDGLEKRVKDLEAEVSRLKAKLQALEAQIQNKE